MDELSIPHGGLSTPHDPAWVCQRPRGLPDWIFLCFATAYWMETRRGPFQGAPGDVWVFPPNAPHTHGNPAGAERGFVNDWIHVRGAEIQSLVKKYGIPLEKPIPTGRGETLTAGIRRLLFESGLKRPFYREALRLEFEGLLVRLGRLAALPGPGPTGTAPRLHLPTFLGLRSEIMADPAMSFSVPQAARRVGLSPSRFTVLWRRFFGRSPADDHLMMRLDRARGLLAEGDAPVGRVAEVCGFESPMYFSRIFRKRVGTTPSAYRFHPDIEGPRPGTSLIEDALIKKV